MWSTRAWSNRAHAGGGGVQREKGKPGPAKASVMEIFWSMEISWPIPLPMSEVFFILGRATIFLTTHDSFRGVLLASNEVRSEVIALVKVVKLNRAPNHTVANVCTCRQLMTLNLSYYRGLYALPERIGDCAVLKVLTMSYCDTLTALPERLGDCAALTTLNLTSCRGFAALPERLGDCAALMTLNLTSCRGLTALPERIGDCAVLTALALYFCSVLTALPRVARRLCDADGANAVVLRRSNRTARSARRLRGTDDAEPVVQLQFHRTARAAQRLRGAHDAEADVL